MRKCFFLIIAAAGLISCESKYPGFTMADNGIWYRLAEIGDDTVKVKPGDFITAEITYKTIRDSSFFKGSRKFQVNGSFFEGSIDQCFTMLSKEDKATFIISADSFFRKTLQVKLPRFIMPGSDMMVDIKVAEIQPEQEYLQEKEAFLHWIEDFGDYEKVILRQFIENKKIHASRSTTGMYYIQLRKGNGKKAEKGKVVEVDYEGKFLDGKFFDSTKKRREPYQFVYGQEMQVIKGLDEAIGRMEEGEKALVILPSDLAFGSAGSSTGIIPPYTSLIFEIELRSVKDLVKPK